MKYIARSVAVVALSLVTLVALTMSLTWLYFKTGGKDKLPHSLTSTYATTVYDPVTEQSLPVLEANYYANKNKTGYEVIEFRMNVYSGVNKQAVYARGFQLAWDKNGKPVQYTEPTTQEKINLWYYDSYNNTSFETGHAYGWGDKMIIDIDGKSYAVALDGKYTTSTTGFNLGKATGNFFKAVFTDWSMFGVSENWNTTTYYEHNYSYEDLLLKIRNIIKSSSNGTGDGVISLIDLGDFLHIYELDEHGNPKNEPIGKNGLINSYFTMATHYDNRGMTWTKQSLFNSVAGNNQFNITGLTDDMEYWQANSVYTLSEQDFEARYTEQGYYYVLPTALINQIKDYTDIEVDIVFDIAKLKDKVLGFDYYALYGIKVHSLTIKSNTEQDFRLQVGALKETGLTTDKIITNNINLTGVLA